MRSAWAGIARMLRRAVATALLCIVMLSGAAFGQNPYYLRTTAAFSWFDPASHTLVAFSRGASCKAGSYVNAPEDDDISAAIPIGFTFNFGGTSYTQLQIQSNGRLQFNNAFCGYGTQSVGPPPTYPYAYPSADVVRTMRIYGGDLYPGVGGGGQVRYATLGTAPNRRFVVTWVSVEEWNSGTSAFSLQIVLYEGSNEFIYQYKDIENQTAGAAQIGWQIDTGNYEVVPYGGFGTLAYTALRFYPAPVKIAEYRMDEYAWSGSAGEVVDSSGSGYHARAMNKAAIGDGSRAYTDRSNGTNTCRYGSFDGAKQYVELTKFPDLDAASSPSGFTITAWIRTRDRSKIGQRILIDDEGSPGDRSGWGLSLGDGGAGRIRFYSRSTDPVYVDTGAVVANDAWYFVAAVVDFTLRQKSIFVYDQSGALIDRVVQAYTGSWASDAGTASIGGETDASAEAGAGYRFTGNIDEVRVYRGLVGTAALEALLATTRLCADMPSVIGRFNAFESSTAAGAVFGVIKTKVAGANFAASTGNLALVALNAGRTAVDTSFTGTVKVELLDASSGGALDANGCSASNAWPAIQTLASQTFASGNAGRINLAAAPTESNAWRNVKVRVSFPATGAASLVGCSTDAFAIRPNRFLISGANDADWETPGTTRSLANMSASGGVVHKAGHYFTLRVTAVNAAGTGTANYAGTPIVYGTSMRLPDPTTCATCVPGTFTPGAWVSRGAGVVQTDTATYSEAGALAAQVEDRSWASVDQSDSNESERHVPSGPFTIGRFVPARFDVSFLAAPVFRTFGTSDASCNASASAPKRSFTYIGQPFDLAAELQLRVEAKNKDGAVTRNYRGALWKLGAGAASQNAVCAGTNPNCGYTANFSSGGAVSTLTRNYTYTTVPASSPGWDVPSSSAGTPTFVSNNDGTGTVTHTQADRLAFTRNAAQPQLPFTANIALTVSVTDASEAAVSGNGVVGTGSTAGADPVAFDAGAIFRYGRLRLGNANGSQLLALVLPLEVQFWNGAGFATHSADQCTTVPTASIALGNFQRNLAVGETTLSVPTGPVLGGVKALMLSAPGAGNDGSADVVVNLGATSTENLCGPDTFTSVGANLPWLRSRWCGADFDRDPTARATFGIYRSTTPFIYQRENY